MVAAYLVGTRGTARHAVALGATVTVTHTIGVFALGVVALALSAVRAARAALPVAEPRRPACSWSASGRAVLRRRVRRARVPAHEHITTTTSTAMTTVTATITTTTPSCDPRALLAMGASAGLIPCPSALVVLLGAISQHRIGLGLVLIVAFSAGLAATLTGLGLLVVRRGGRPRGSAARGRARVRRACCPP